MKWFLARNFNDILTAASFFAILMSRGCFSYIVDLKIFFQNFWKFSQGIFHFKNSVPEVWRKFLARKQKHSANFEFFLTIPFNLKQASTKIIQETPPLFSERKIRKKNFNRNFFPIFYSLSNTLNLGDVIHRLLSLLTRTKISCINTLRLKSLKMTQLLY